MTLAICLSLSATVILLCLFAPKLYIVLFNPSKNIHVKFKTTLSTPQTSMEHPSASNHLEDLAANAANRRRRHTSSDYTTEVSLFNSKSDSSPLTPNDETTQTGTECLPFMPLAAACTDAERQQRVAQDDDEEERRDHLSVSKQRTNPNHLHHSPVKPSSSNLAIPTENPWKKLSNVRYKLDSPDGNQRNPTPYDHVHAQHITFV